MQESIADMEQKLISAVSALSSSLTSVKEMNKERLVLWEQQQKGLE